MIKTKVNKKVLYSTLALTFIGLLIFFSASLSQLKNNEIFISIFFKQLISIFFGLLGMFIIVKLKFITGR
jgi:cell division protein FtsW (lipid II flippase)